MGAERLPRDLLVRIGAGLFALHRPDGTVETFAHRSPAGVGVQRVFMTERKVPMGHTQHFTFDGMTRLTSMRDAAGKGFDLRYDDPSDVWRLSRVVDVYGREARFIYNREGQLVRIVDARGRNTDFAYPANSRESDLVTGVATPEGGWIFRYGEENLDRWVELIDAEGRCHRAEFRHDAPGMPTTDADAPSGPLNQYMHDRSTYYWGPEALSRHRGDYKQAEAIRYLFNPTQLALSWTLEAVKQAKEPRIWFLYPGQVNTQVEGNRISPRWVSQKYPEVLSQWNLVWDDLGRLTEVSEKGGRAVFTYPDGPGTNPRSVRVDLQGATLHEEWDGAGRLLGRMRGNRRVWKAVRDERGTIRSISDTSGRMWKMTYDSSGRWSGIRGAASFEWTYDSLDRVASLRKNGGIPQSITYDELDRIQGVDRFTREHPNKTNRKFHFLGSVARAKALAGAGIQEPPLSLPIPSCIRNFMALRIGEREMERGNMNKVTKGKKHLAELFREWLRVIHALEPGLN